MFSANASRPTPHGLRRVRCALRCGVVIAMAAGVTGCGGGETPAKPPNLLLITVDTLRADRLACYGGPPDVGTYVCGMGDAGTRFTWAFATAPVTAPSVASILTGLYASAHGVRQTAASFLAREVETLPEVLRDAGYSTAAFVSNPVLERSRQLDQGFGVYDQRMPRIERNRPGFVERDARSTTDAALGWAQTAAESPWFLWVHFQDPRGPYDPPGEAPAVDAPEDTPLRLLSEDESGFGGIPAYQALPGVFTREAYERRYLAEIRYLEGHLQRLVEGLDRLGDPPSVLLTADHGEAFGEDGFYFAHGHSVGLDQIRVPLLWRPGTPTAPRVVSETVSLVDVAPTLLAAAGLPVPAKWQGRPLPLGGAEADSQPASPRALFAEHGRHSAVVAGGRYYARDHGAEDEFAADAELATDNELAADDGFDAGDESLPDTVFFPPRTARLLADGTVGEYEPAEPSGPSGPLEGELVRFLSDAARRNAGATRETASDELRARLRALGYAD